MDPESNKTLSKVLDLTKEMVPVTIIVTKEMVPVTIIVTDVTQLSEQ